MHKVLAAHTRYIWITMILVALLVVHGTVGVALADQLPRAMKLLLGLGF